MTNHKIDYEKTVEAYRKAVAKRDNKQDAAKYGNHLVSLLWYRDPHVFRTFRSHATMWKWLLDYYFYTGGCEDEIPSKRLFKQALNHGIRTGALLVTVDTNGLRRYDIDPLYPAPHNPTRQKAHFGD